jgi:RNA ligase (TIGR02306 family)
MSTHSVKIIEIVAVKPHAGAERLEIIPIDGWQAVVKRGQFKPGDRAVYIQPDYTVPTARPEFAFLAREGRDRHRLKAVRLRGVLSFGLLIPVPDDLSSRLVGDDVMTALGIERYDPPVAMAGADDLPSDRWPRAHAGKFDIESLQNFPGVIAAGEQVVITEKVHGANARYLVEDGTFFIGSRTRWLKPDVAHPWARAADADPRIRAWCAAHPGMVLYGEIYGAVQSLKYGCKPGEVRFVAFAVSDKGEWRDTSALLDDATLPTVPVLYRGPFDPARLAEFAEADSGIPGVPAGHMREGVVIVPAAERRDERVGRVALKHISARYWEGAD